MYYSVMPKRSIVAERIEDLLRIKNMSAADLSDASGVTESAISNILSGKRLRPRSDTVQKIAMGFPTSTDYLNGKTDNHEPSDAPSLPPYAAEVLESMRKLDNVQNYELYIVAKGFVEAKKEVRQLTRNQIIEMLLDYGDIVAGAEETDRVMRLLEDLERKSQGDDDSALLTAS